MRRWTALAMAAALVGLSACNGDPKAAPTTGATVGTEPPRTTTTDPLAIPATIDAAYVNRVLAGLDAAVGDVVRMVVATKTIPREGFDRLKAVYANDAGLNAVLDSLSKDLARGLPGFRPQPGDKLTKISELLFASPTCIFSKVARDYTRVSEGPVATDDTQWIAVRPLDPGRDPFGYNKVGWAYIYEGSQQGLQAPRNPCV